MSDEQVVETKTEETQVDSTQTTEASALSKEDIEKMIQSAADKVRTEYSTKLKAVEEEKETLQKEKMSAAERAKFESEQREKAMADKDAEIAKRELALDKASVIAELEVPKALAPFVQGDSKETISSSAKALMEILAAEVAKGVEVKLVGTSTPPVVGDPVVPVNQAKLDDLSAWKAIWAMEPGPDKDKAEAAMITAASNIKE